MTILWTSDAAARASGGQAQGQWQATGLSIDTRSLEPGDLFVALADQRDGHDFVAAAFAKGAAGALVTHRPKDVTPEAPLLLVPDVLKALENMARARRHETRARIVAVTGSVGKTSTKDMLAVILAGQGRTHAAEKSFNNQWGVPLTLARMPVDCDFGVFEIGMNHPGEIAPLAAMVSPDVALISNVAAVHLEAFDSIEAIAREKAAIFSGMAPDGVAVINGDLPVTPILQKAATTAMLKGITFGTQAGTDFTVTQAEVADTITRVSVDHGDDHFLFKLNCAGQHFALNAVGALAAATELGADLAIATMDIGNWAPPAGRGARERIVLDVVEDHLTLELIDDAFNASPISMGAALNVLASAPVARPGRRIAILGDMLELGADEVQHHRDIAALDALGAIDLVHTVGPRMAVLHGTLAPVQQGQWFETADDMAAQVHHLVRAGDVILVKGSKGSLVSRVVDAIRKLGQGQGATGQRDMRDA